MKVNEIINEGPMWDRVKGAASAVKTAGGKAVNTAKAIGGGLASAKAGYQASQQARAGAEVANKVAQLNINKWNQYVGQLKAAGQAPSIENLQQFVQQIAGTANIAAPQNVNDARAVANYITQSINQHIANSKVAPNQPAAAAPAGNTAQRPQLAPGVQVIHQEPDIISYQKVSYVANDQGLWTPINSNKPVNQAMQAFLTKQADLATPGGNTAG
jgi:hypothetical protein